MKTKQKGSPSAVKDWLAANPASRRVYCLACQDDRIRTALEEFRAAGEPMSLAQFHARYLVGELGCELSYAAIRQHYANHVKVTK